MVAAGPSSQPFMPKTERPALLESLTKAKPPQRARTWLVPGETAWEIWEQSESGYQLAKQLGEDATGPLADISAVALPAQFVTCQLFWLETTDEKAIPDLVRMQCERRLLLRQDEVWTYRILRNEGERSLAQVLILQNTIPPLIEAEGDVLFEAHARCLSLPPQALCIWRTLGAVCLALTDENGVVYFQLLPHRTLSRECLKDVKSLLWLASAQNWGAATDSLVLVGDWNQTSASELEDATGLRVTRMSLDQLALPTAPMELTPRSVKRLRVTRRRQQRFRLGALVLAALYALFLGGQILFGVFTSLSNTKLQTRLGAIMPRVLEMQNTAQRLDALNPALDVKTYALEILYRAMAVLPESGVRLTRFEISGNRLEVSGESSTAREAFEYINNLEASEALRHIQWEEAPQPVPLPNDTTRFFIKGTITGAYNDAEET